MCVCVHVSVEGGFHCSFYNFHVVFGHFAQIALPPQVDPIGETLPCVATALFQK